MPKPREYLKKMEPAFVESRRIDACMFRYNSAWEALVRRDLSRARHQVEEALRLALDAGTPFHEGISRIALAQVLHEQGEDDAALPQLSQALRIAGRMKSRILEFMCFLSQAHLALDRGKDAEALLFLAKAMALGREKGYTNFYWWRRDVMSRLCSRALDAGIETGYVQDLIRKRSLRPPVPASDSWPWPLQDLHARAVRTRQQREAVDLLRQGPAEAACPAQIIDRAGRQGSGRGPVRRYSVARRGRGSGA